jgi:hypothetical protein
LGPFKEFGIGLGLLYSIDRLLSRLSSGLGLYVYEIMAQPIVGRDLLPAALAKSVEFEDIRSGHPDLERVETPTEVKCARFAQGAKCLAAYRRGKMLGYIWWCGHSYLEDEVGCTYVLDEQAQSVFDFDLYVIPEQRLGIAFAAIWHGANARLREQGVRFSCSRVSRFNLASRKAHARLGARPLGWATFLKVGKVRFMVSTIRPFLALAPSAGHAICLKIDPNRSGLRRQQ